VEPLPKLGADLMSQIALHSRVSLTGWDGDTLMCESPRFYFGLLARNFQLLRLFGSAVQYVQTKKSLPPIGLRTWLKRKLGKYPVPTLYPNWVNQSFAARVNLVDRWRVLNTELPAAHPTRPKTVELLAGSNWWCLFENSDPGVSTVPVEIRHPFMDVRLVKYLLAIPSVPWCVDKHILRESVRGVLPEEIRRRPKAPAAGNLSLERARETKPDWLNSPDPLSDLSNFVAIDKIPRMSPDLGSANWWVDIRLHSLNRWLKGFGRLSSTQVGTMRSIPSAIRQVM
jgi:asparagine synthase (glutamine-hydrolysing)